MSISDSLFQFATGFSDGILMHASKIHELDCHQGANPLLVAGIQIEQAIYALYAIDNVINTLANPLILNSFSLGQNFILNASIQNACSYAAIAFIAYAGWARDNQKPAVTFKEKMIVFVNDHAGNISQIIVLISAVAECILGNPIKGSATLMMFGIGYLDRNGYFKWEFRLFFSKKVVPIVNMFTLITGDTLKKVIAAFELAVHFSTIAQKPFLLLDRAITKMRGNIYPPIELTLPKEVPDEKIGEPKFTADELLNFDLSIPLELDYSHLQRIIKYEIDVDAKFETLKSLLDQIGFEGEAFTRLVNKIEKDSRFERALANLITDNPHLEKVKREGKAWQSFVFEYGRSQLHSFVATLKKTEKTKTDSRNLETTLLDNPDELARVLKLVKKLSYQGDSRDLEAFLTLLKPYEGMAANPVDLGPALKPALFVVSHIESLLKIIDQSKIEKEKMNAKCEAQNLLSILMTEGGAYCAQGIHDAVMDCFGRILSQGKGTASLQTLLDVMAQMIREQGFNQLYALFLANKISLYEDRHLFQAIKNGLGLGIGLPRTQVPDVRELVISILNTTWRTIFWSSNAKNSILKEITNLETQLKNMSLDLAQADQSNWIILRTAKKINVRLKTFWLTISIGHLKVMQNINEATFQYNAETLIECAQSHMENPKQRSQYQDWWMNYAAKIAGNNGKLWKKLNKEILMNLTDGKMMNSKLTPKFLTIMLIEMDFIKKPHEILKPIVVSI